MNINWIKSTHIFITYMNINWIKSTHIFIKWMKYIKMSVIVYSRLIKLEYDLNNVEAFID